MRVWVGSVRVHGRAILSLQAAVQGMWEGWRHGHEGKIECRQYVFDLGFSDGRGQPDNMCAAAVNLRRCTGRFQIVGMLGTCRALGCVLIFAQILSQPEKVASCQPAKQLARIWMQIHGRGMHWQDTPSTSCDTRRIYKQCTSADCINVVNSSCLDWRQPGHAHRIDGHGRKI